MRYSIRTVGPVAPATEIPLVISVDQAKAHLGVVHDGDDDLVEALIRAAQDHIEHHTSQVLTPREMELAIAGFPASPRWGATEDAIELPRAPVTAITAIDYADSDGAPSTLVEADWRWNEAEPTMIWPAYSTSWPSAYPEPGSVRVTFEAGYEEGLAPASLEAAVRLMVGHLYANREAVNVGNIVAAMPFGVEALCAPYRRVGL